MTSDTAPFFAIGRIELDAEKRRVVGWCWAPDAPLDRLAVDILVGDDLIGSIVAALPSPDALEFGYGDGRCGFSFALPPWLLEHLRTDASRIAVSVRERRSRLVIDRIVLGSDIKPDPGFAQLRDGAAELAPLSGHLALALGADAAKAARLRAACGELGALLTGRARAAGRAPASPLAALLEALHARLGRIALPVPCTPPLTLILEAGADVAHTHAALLGLLPGLRATGCEVILADPNGDPAHRLLPALVENLRYLQGPHAAGDAANAAMGVHLAFLRSTAAAPAAAGLLGLCACLARQPELLILDRACLDRLAEGLAGLPDIARAPAMEGHAGLPLRLALPRRLYVELGRFSPSLAGDPALQCADLFLRAKLALHPNAIWAPPASARPAIAAPRRPSGARAVAAAAFHATWNAMTTTRRSA